MNHASCYQVPVIPVDHCAHQRSLWNRREGGTAGRLDSSPFVLAMIGLPLLGLVQLSIDTSRQVQMQSFLQMTVDAAALDGARAFKWNASHAAAERQSVDSFFQAVAHRPARIDCEIEQVVASKADRSLSITAVCHKPSLVGAKLFREIRGQVKVSAKAVFEDASRDSPKTDAQAQARLVE